LPKDCQNTLTNLQKEIDDGSIRDKINYALYQVVHAGRESGGATPRETFQVYVPGYIQFFNEQETACDQFSWGYWPFSKPKLTTDLRKQLNDKTRQINDQIKSATKDLERMGVIFIDGLDEAYKNHRFCESRHTEYPMIDYETWFWSPYNKFNTPSEGPGDPNEAYPDGDVNPAQQLLEFVFPGRVHDASQVSEDSPPWQWDGADKYPTFDDLISAIRQSEDVNATIVPLPYLRSFHPKGTAFGTHKTYIFGAIADNREAEIPLSTPPPPPPSEEPEHRQPTKTMQVFWSEVSDGVSPLAWYWQIYLGEAGKGVDPCEATPINNIYDFSAPSGKNFWNDAPTTVSGQWDINVDGIDCVFFGDRLECPGANNMLSIPCTADPRPFDDCASIGMPSKAIVHCDW
jgi:hypothetical protein